jgi:aldose 1-epimerase
MTERTTERVRLGHGDLSVELAPEIGGGVARFTWRGEDILRPAQASALRDRDVLGLSNFPLIPFAGRITKRRFRFEERDIALPPNLHGEAAAIHGQGWRLPWRLDEAGPTNARLSCEHRAGAWPWDYRASQVFALESDTLVHRIEVINLSDRPMPAGLGLHPYFPRDEDTRLTASVNGVRRTVAGPPDVVPAEWDWNTGVAIEAFVDNQFSGWSGHARIDWPLRDLAVTLSTDPARPHLVVYAPIGEAYFCVEPVGHILDAVNLSPGGADHGMIVLAPGEATSLTVRFEVGRSNL